MADNPQIKIPDMCEIHKSELVRKAKYGPNDTWRALIICTQIALFQAATVTPAIQKKLGGDILLIEQIGCFACRLPHRFAAILRTAMRSRDLGAIKELGESWIKEASKKNEPS